uniref:Ionotropic glutamate receptor C-terminal domain-containing protein n=1 Tax=Anopheles maculatus TaxID=74869 RepID=A0A182T611_9DIPT
MGVVDTAPTNEERFVVDFLTVKHCKQAIIFDCFSDDDRSTFDHVYILKAANTRSVSVRFIDITTDNRYPYVTTIFTPCQFAKLCTVLDFTCPGASKLLGDIDRENVTSEMVDRLLSEPGLTKGIVAFVKYHYALLVVLRDFHNFTIKYRPTRGWAGRLRSGYRLGLLGVVQRHETDVAATGIIMRLSRQPELDSIHYSWAFETGFIYKITPDIGSKSEGNGFVAPFSPSVWVTFLLSLALSVVVLKYLAKLSERCPSHSERTRATIAYVLDVMSCVAQQGVPNVSRLVPARVAVMVLLVANLVLYNYYTSTVVSGLLSSKMIGPESIPQVIDSPLKLSLTDTGYHRILLREQTLPYSTRMHERKALPPRSPEDLPLFTDVEHAVPYLRRGGHVLHCELTEVYPTIANQFTANEICELRTVPTIYNDASLIGLINVQHVEGLYKYDIRVMAFILPKHSMYSELFKITLMRAQETGIVKRIYRIHKIAKPICQGSATVYSVELTESESHYRG